MNEHHVILSGASGNIGGRLAHFLLLNGYNLIVTSKDAKKLSELKTIFSKFSAQIKFYHLNLEHKASIDNFVKDIENISVTGLINNSATDNMDTISDLSYENMQSIMSVNYLGTAYLSKLMITKNIKTNRPLRIVNMSSLLSIYGAEKSAAYSASKAALEAFSRNIVSEFGHLGIFCNNIRVAGVSGNVNIYNKDKNIVRFDEPIPDNTKNNLNHIPERRFMKFEELSSFINFLLSGKCDYLNGQSMNIDGGISIKYPGYSIA
jgi:3-oxoacyl-[acyl-carrier protein] reductase